MLAPIGGRLGLRQVDPGNLVRANDANGLVVITQMRPISVIFTVPEDRPPRRVEALPRRPRCRSKPGTAADDQQAGGGHAADHRQPDRHCHRHDQAAGRSSTNATNVVPEPVRQHPAAVDTLANATVIPAAAVQRASFGTFVYVVKPDNRSRSAASPSARPKATASPSPAAWTPSEKIVLEGVDDLTEGAKIEVHPRGHGAAPAGRAAAQSWWTQQPWRRRRRGRAMNISRPFILRPVATALLMAGAAAVRHRSPTGCCRCRRCRRWTTRPSRSLTFYPGASPDVMTSAVTAPLERQFGQMPGLAQMSSTSSGGASVITLQFTLE